MLRHFGMGAERGCVWRAMEMPWDQSTVFYATQMALYDPHSSKWKCFRLHMTFLSSPSTGYLGMDPVLAQRGPDMPVLP